MTENKPSFIYPRLQLAYLLQFGSFGDRVVLGTFLMLRLQQGWLERGLPMQEAADRARVQHL